MALSQAAAKTFTQCCNCVALSQVLLSAIFQTKNDMHLSLHVHFYVFRCVRSDAVLYSCIPLSIWLVLGVLSPLELRWCPWTLIEIQQHHVVGVL